MSLSSFIHPILHYPTSQFGEKTENIHIPPYPQVILSQLLVPLDSTIEGTILGLTTRVTSTITSIMVSKINS